MSNAPTSPADRQRVSIEVDPDREVEGLWRWPAEPRAVLVLGHGAGAGMEHPFLEALTDRLFTQRVATLRYQFHYMQVGRRRPDARSVLLATVRAAIDLGRRVAGPLPLFAGGKSMGGRMTSTAVAEQAEAGVRGLVFVGFPLHPAGRPGVERAEHLARVEVPMLFLQGTRDKLAELDLLRPELANLGERPTLHIVEGADHGFHVLKRSGRTDEEVLDELAAEIAGWCGG